MSGFDDLSAEQLELAEDVASCGAYLSRIRIELAAAELSLGQAVYKAVASGITWNHAADLASMPLASARNLAKRADEIVASADTSPENRA